MLMGRRALRKIDPQLDLSQHLRSIEQLPERLDPGDLFRVDGPIEIEIGSGKGLFLLRASGEVAQHNFLGVELTLKYARFAAARLAKVQRNNALVLQGDARQLVQDRLPDQCAVNVHVYFPDPWWKMRHRKRRIMDNVFVSHIERILTTPGSLHFWTDVEEYFAATVALIRETTTLRGPQEVAEAPADHDLDYRTHFERRMRLHDQTVYRAEFIKA